MYVIQFEYRINWHKLIRTYLVDFSYAFWRDAVCVAEAFKVGRGFDQHKLFQVAGLPVFKAEYLLTVAYAAAKHHIMPQKQPPAR